MSVSSRFDTLGGKLVAIALQLKEVKQKGAPDRLGQEHPFAYAFEDGSGFKVFVCI